MLLICLPTSSVTASRWLSSCYSRKLQTRLLWLTCCHHCLVLSGQTKTDVAEGLSGVETPPVSCLSQQGLRMQQKSRSYIQSYSQWQPVDGKPVNVQPQTGTDAVFLPGNDTVPLFHLCTHHWVIRVERRSEQDQHQNLVDPFLWSQFHHFWPKTKLWHSAQSHTYWQ